MHPGVSPGHHSNLGYRLVCHASWNVGAGLVYIQYTPHINLYYILWYQLGDSGISDHHRPSFHACSLSLLILSPMYYQMLFMPPTAVLYPISQINNVPKITHLCINYKSLLSKCSFIQFRKVRCIVDIEMMRLPIPGTSMDTHSAGSLTYLYLTNASHFVALF